MCLDPGCRRLAQARALLTALLTAATSALPTACGATQGSARHGRQPRPTTSAVLLTQRLIGAAELPGMHAIQIPTVIRSAATWEQGVGLVGPQLERETAALTRLGFFAGVRQTLDGQGRSTVEITSVVERFRSAAGARANLARASRHPRGPGVQPRLRVHPFRVAAIPGAVGESTAGPFSSSQSVAFVAGPFYYQVVAITPRAREQAPTRARLIAACTVAYRRLGRASSA
jgi:hypothetical protein